MVVIKKLPIVNNSSNNNTQSRLPPSFLDESKSTPLPSTTIRYDPSRTWPFVYNPVGMTWPRETCQKLGLRFIAHNGVRHEDLMYSSSVLIFGNVSPSVVMVILSLHQYHM